MRSWMMLMAACPLAILGACANDTAEPTDLRSSEPGVRTVSAQAMAAAVCAACHGEFLTGMTSPRVTPSLVGAADYTREEFESLIVAGTTHDGLAGDAEMHGYVAVLTLEDRDALHTYLQTLTEQTFRPGDPPPQAPQSGVRR